MSLPPADLAGATLGQVAVRIRDLSRAVAFYRDRLGLPLLFEFPGLAFFQAGGTRLMLSVPEEKEYDHPASILYFNVADIEAVHRTLASRGVAFIDKPHVIHRTPTSELWMTFFRDGEDNTFALMSEKAI
jgi:methylmalonyl-CoA/ethylmalonyl-CoA epimerase